MTIIKMTEKDILKKHPMTRELRRKIRAVNDSNLMDDAEWTPNMFENAVRIGRPPKANKKRAVNLRLDPEVVEGFKKTGPNWQTRINDTLREWLQWRSML